MSKGYNKILTGLALFSYIAAFYPAFVILVGKWNNSDEYSHAFLVVPIILYLIWKKKDQIDFSKIRFSWLGLVGLVLFSVLYYFALLTEIHSVILLSLFLSLVSGLVFLFGLQVISVFFTPLFLFLLLIPIPDQLYIKLTFPLQLKVSEISEVIVRGLGIPIFREGNIMHIPQKSFEVVDACSGLRSIIALTSLSVIVGYFMLGRSLSKIILFFMSIPIAILVNIFRVVGMILAYHYFALDLTTGKLHDAVGLGVFILSLILLLITQKLLEWRERR